jgi:hypothetical protein
MSWFCDLPQRIERLAVVVRLLRFDQSIAF